MANNNNADDELGISLFADTKKFEQQLAAIYKRVESKGVTVKVNAIIDPEAVKTLAKFQQDITKAFQGTGMAVSQNAKEFQTFFSAISRGIASLNKNSKAAQTIGDNFTTLARRLSTIQINQAQARQVTDFFGGMARSGTQLLRVTKNVDAMVAAINKLIGRLQILQKTGQLDVLKNLPANMGFTEKGGVRMQPIKVIAPNEAEWNKIKAQMENRIAAKPIKAKIEPEMSNQGLQKFQNLLIALSFGQFSQNLERMSRQIISSYSSIEQAQTTLRTVYRDNPKRAEQVYGFLTRKEAETPFNFEEMLQGGTQFAVQEKQMRRYGFGVERAVNMASELAAAFGQGKPGAIMDIQTGISRLMTGDQNGFEILDKYGISRSSLRQSGLAVGKTGVKLKSDDDIKAVLEAIERFQMKTTGGNLAERQNQTVAGQISNMQSQLMKTQASLMAPLEGTFRQGVSVVGDFLKALEEAPAPLRGLVGAFVLGTTLIMKAAQQVASVGLLVLGANNAGLFDSFKKGAANTAAQSGGSLTASMVGGGAGGVMSRLFPTIMAGGEGAGFIAGVTGIFSTLVNGIVAVLSVEVGAFLSAIAAPVAALFTAAVAGFAGVKLLTDPRSLGTMAKDFMGMDTSGVNFAQANATYQASWWGNGDVAKDNRARYSEASRISRMTPKEVQENGISKKQINSALALTMKRERDLYNSIYHGNANGILPGYQREDEGATVSQREELKGLRDQIEKLRQAREDYNEELDETNRKSETELQIADATAKARFKLGEIDSTQYAQSMKEKLDKRQRELKDAQAEGDYNKIATATQNWLEALVEAKDANKQILDDMRGQVKAANDLVMATGGTEGDAIAAAAQDANLMPHDTAAEINARNSALAGVEGRRVNLERATKRRGYDYLEGTGDTLGAQIGRFSMDAEDAFRASGGTKTDRAEIDKITNQKILQARFDFYQQLLKLAQENLQALQGIETQRLATAKASNDSAMTLLGGRMGRMNIEGQLSSNPEMKRLALKQQDLIMSETKLRQQQAKAKYDTELQQLTSAINNAKAKGGVPAAQLSSMQRQIELRKEAFRGEKLQIATEGASSLASARQGEGFRNEDLTREGTVSALESQAEAARIKREKIEADMGKSKEKYIDLLKQQLKLELDILKTKLEAALKDPKLTKQQRENLEAQYQNDVNAAQTKYGGLASDSKVAGYQAKIETYKSAMASDPKMKPKDQLMNLKKQLELEKAILFEKYKKDAAQPGADKLALQKNYLKDLNNLQLEYLDSAKKVTGEMDAQNKALEDRYRNKDQKGMFSGFSMGEVFGIEDLAANMAMDSEYSAMKYDQLGKKGGFDPFSKDKWDVKDYANQGKQAAYGDDKLGKIPGSAKELEKADIKAEFVLKVELPDGSTKTYQAYNGNLPNGLKGNK